MIRGSERGSVVVVGVAMLLLLSLLAVTYVTVMEIEVKSNEAFQYGMKADMIVNWFMADACAIVQSSVRNVGIYEDENDVPVGVWHGMDYANNESMWNSGGKHNHGMRWQNPPHNWYMLPLIDMRGVDADFYSGFQDAYSSSNIYHGYISPEGRIFGEQNEWMWYAYQEYDIDLVNFDGDFDPRTHRQARWRTYRNPDPDYADTWENIYARSAGLMLSTQSMLYLGEYRGDFTDRTNANYFLGHERRMTRSGAKLSVNTRPVGYNLAVYLPGEGGGNDTAWNRADHANDLTHIYDEGTGVAPDRVDRSKLDPNPRVEGINRVGGANQRKDIDYPGGINILNDGPAVDSMPDIDYWRGGEGMMNINALIRMLSHLCNERAATAIAKHRPYRTKQQMLQAVELEGATLTTTEYARLMSNVTCHSNYDPVTGFCPLNINKLRSPQSVMSQREAGPDPLLEGPNGIFYDRDIDNYLPTPAAPGNSSPYRYTSVWFADYQLFSMMDNSDRTWGDMDPNTGVYYENNAPAVRISNRMLWAAFSCIPSLVINSSSTNVNGGSAHEASVYDPYWDKMASYAEREYARAIDRGCEIWSNRVGTTFTPSKLLSLVLGILQNETGGKMNWCSANPGQSGGGSRAWSGYAHPSLFVNFRHRDSYAHAGGVGVGRKLTNMSGDSGTGLYDMTAYANPGSGDYYWGWSPIQQGSDSEFDEIDGAWRNAGDINRMRFYSRMYWGFFVEDMDRFEEMIAWMAPFHPVANPHGRSIITERQANDILNNFIDFRDNIQDPNNVMADWKLHSQEYDRGNYEAYRQNLSANGRFVKGMHKDGTVNDDSGNNDHLNTVCSMANYNNISPIRFPDAGAAPGAGVRAKVPYIYIKEPYFSSQPYQDAIAPDPEINYTSSSSEEPVGQYFLNALDWNSRYQLRKGESIIEYNWNVPTLSSGNSPDIGFPWLLNGYGDGDIVARMETNGTADLNYPWVNDMHSQDLNIQGIGRSNISLNHRDTSWIRNYNWSSFNWQKDWLAFNYHRNMHDPREFVGGVSFPAGSYKLHSDFVADGSMRRVANPLYGADTSTANDGLDPPNPVDDLGNDKWDYSGPPSWVYYESPGIVFGADRIPDAYQTLNKGTVLVDLALYPALGQVTSQQQLFADLRDTNLDRIPNDTANNNVGAGCMADSQAHNYDRAFNAFMDNCTDRVGGYNTYGLERSDRARTPTLAIDSDCKPMTAFGYRGQDHTNSSSRSEWARIGRFDYKTDSTYFFGTYSHSSSGRKTPRPSWSSHGQLITLANKPYLFDVPMKSIKKCDGAQGGSDSITFGYSYNYGRNVYAYDFDGNALGAQGMNPNLGNDDLVCPTMFRLQEDGAGGVRYVPERYGERGVVAGPGGKFKTGGGWDGNRLNTIADLIATQMGLAANLVEMTDIVPRFNAVEPFFDPMYPNGRLFYRRLMACGDTTIVLNNRYYNGAVNNSNTGNLYGMPEYDPADFATYYNNKNNLLKTLDYVKVRSEASTADNPFLQDNAAYIGGGTGSVVPGDPGLTVQTESWPVAGGNVADGMGGATSTSHWNHVYHARYALPWIIDDTGGARGQLQRACADSPWSVPLCVRDRFFELRVKAEIINTGLAASESEWRGIDILASKQAVAIFDRGWRWAYWDDSDPGQPQACAYYDPFQMVGSRPGVDAAYDAVAPRTDMGLTCKALILDNEMCTPNDFSDGVDGEDKTHFYNRSRAGGGEVPVGYLAPAEYSGVNRPGDDCAERARIVSFKWLGINQ